MHGRASVRGNNDQETKLLSLKWSQMLMVGEEKQWMATESSDSPMPGVHPPSPSQICSAAASFPRLLQSLEKKDYLKQTLRVSCCEQCWIKYSHSMRKASMWVCITPSGEVGTPACPWHPADAFEPGVSSLFVFSRHPLHQDIGVFRRSPCLGTRIVLNFPCG